MAKLRLIKVLVQPVFVLDDGKNVTEVVYGQDANGNPIMDHPAVAIPAADWPAYSGERFPAEVKQWQAQLDAETEPDPPKQPHADTHNPTKGAD